jgi:hypothetical protein
MGSDATKLLEAALKLPPEAQAAMAGSLLESLDTVVDADAEVEWDREIARRLKDLDAAPTVLCPGVMPAKRFSVADAGPSRCFPSRGC